MAAAGPCSLKTEGCAPPRVCPSVCAHEPHVLLWGCSFSQRACVCVCVCVCVPTLPAPHAHTHTRTVSAPVCGRVGRREGSQLRGREGAPDSGDTHAHHSLLFDLFHVSAKGRERQGPPPQIGERACVCRRGRRMLEEEEDGEWKDGGGAQRGRRAAPPLSHPPPAILSEKKNTDEGEKKTAKRRIARTRAPSLPRAGRHACTHIIGRRHERTLVLLDVLLAHVVRGLGADLLVVLLQRSEILARLGELALLHALTHVPVHEGALAVHQVKLVVNAGKHLSDRRRVGNHAHGALHLREVTARHNGRRLVVDAALEARRAPVDELNRPLRLDRRNRGVDILRHDITAVHEAARHVLAVAGIALGQHASGLKDRVRDVSNGQLLVVRLLRRHHGSVARQHEVDARVRHKVRLELRQVHVQRAIEAQRRRQGRHHLADQAVHVRVRRALNVERATSEVVDGLIVKHRRNIGVLEQRVRRQHAVVRLHDGRRHLRARVHGVAKLRLLAVVHRQALQQQRTEARARAATHRVEHHKALETSAVVRQLANAVQRKVDDLLADRVVATSVVVRRILLARHQLLGVEQLAVRAGAHLIHDRGLQVQEEAARNVLAGASLREERVERVILNTDALVRGHGAIRLDAVLKAEQLPARVTDLAAGLADVDADSLTHG
ncbi:alpha tubulin [Leishmania tarentolae]|uniref:Alpha tubulin n=1 Tax=Leishmania tarentolae TaxID=5689 RepID=A0A640KCV7_LEITA|nr:alpha tubulin [Leishmania tarentolae]